MRHLAALAAGLVFGLGITISGMANPAKVLNFFDFFGTWDPSLALVMAAALVVTAIGYRLVLARRAPLFDVKFYVPTSTLLDRRLIGGAAIYGIGWGLVGLCPGGLVPALTFGASEPFVFLAAMLFGMTVARMAPSMIMTRVKPA
ncbi:MAG: DUF6691 family protein [Hyphomicrobiaceae bacterium]|nr:DUF6691 family protein [Hyphomicrobiaceae bacterium]